MKKYSFNKDAELIPLSPIGFNFCYSPVNFAKGDVINGTKRGTVVFFSKNNKSFAIDDSLGILFNMQQEIKSNAIGRGGIAMGGGMRGGAIMRGGGFPMGGGAIIRGGGAGFPVRGGGFPLGLARRGFPSHRRGYYRNGRFYVPQGFSVYNALNGMCYYLDENGFPVYFPCNNWIYDLDVANLP